MTEFEEALAKLIAVKDSIEDLVILDCSRIDRAIETLKERGMPSLYQYNLQKIISTDEEDLNLKLQLIIAEPLQLFLDGKIDIDDLLLQINPIMQAVSEARKCDKFFGTITAE